MKQLTRLRLLSGLGAGLWAASCARADLYAVTDTSAPVSNAGSSSDVGAASGGSGGSPGTADPTTGGTAVNPNTADPTTGGTAGYSSGPEEVTGGLGGHAGSLDPATGGAAGSIDALPGSCPTPVLPPGDSSVTLLVGSVSRSYVLHIPPTYDGTRPVPLIVDFHGIGSSGWGELSDSPYPAITDAEGVVMAFPDGMPGPVGTGWNLGPCCVADVDDLAFARALVGQIQQTACIDARQVYAVGVLTGGGIAYSLACQAADIFAGVAPAAFDLLEETVDDCNPSRPITVVSFRGTAASRVPYDGGASSLVPGMPITFLGAEATFDRWGLIDDCTGSPSEPDGDGCSAFADCADGVEVVLCTKAGGGLEPGDPNIAWPILKRHTL